MKFLDPYEASRAVLIETANVLGAFREEMVVVGGSVPDLLYPNQGHIGTLDVDFAVSSNAMGGNAYSTIMRRLLDAGYIHQAPPTRFKRAVPGLAAPVTLDLVCGQYQAGDKTNVIQIDELQFSCLAGIDLAFEAWDELVIEGPMPDGANNSVKVRVVRPEAFLLIKAYAMDERIKSKDAYDVSFVLGHHPDLAELAGRLRPLLANGIAARGLEILKGKFASIDSVGPARAAEEVQGHGQDFEQVRRAAFEDAQELFRLVRSA